MRHRWAILVSGLMCLAGCTAPQTVRPQSGDEAEREADIRTIGSVSIMANAEPIPVFGVGLVEGLAGTGGGTPPGPFRASLEDYLRKRGVDHIRDRLESEDYAMVFVMGLIPAGARKGELIDLEVTLPPGSKATSLRGGFLTECVLYNYESTRRVNPASVQPERALRGHPLVKAEGPLITGLPDESGESGKSKVAASLSRAWVWGGGRCQLDRPFIIELNPDQQRSAVAAQIQDRLNQTFHGPRGGGQDVANAQSKFSVVISVPPQYRLNKPRYLRVVRAVPLDSAQALDGPYGRRLERQLLDPSTALQAAIRLEALGHESVPMLKAATQSAFPLVRFAAAESLAYLGQTSCADELAKLVEEQPALEAYCLTALASLNQVISQVKLEELLSSPRAETRYGAFRALRVLDANNRMVRGEQLGAFQLHCVAPNSPPLVHLSGGHRAEIVLFGPPQTLKSPFSFLAGNEFTITASAHDQTCTICRFSVREGQQRAQCSLVLGDILKTLADMGGTYADATDLLQQAEATKSLECACAVDALPRIPDVQALAKAAREDPTLSRVTPESLASKNDSESEELFARGR